MSYTMLDKNNFLKLYHLERIFEKEHISWKILEEIYDDYRENHYIRLQEKALQLVNELQKNENLLPDQEKGKIHAIFGRTKEPEHLIEKIIRKIGKEDSEKYRKISVNNYREIVRDLIGIRILVLAKEDWIAPDELIRKKFNQMEETPIAYVCYGDREIYDHEKLYVEYTSKGYRSQHYIVRDQDDFVEIQVRTLSEEVFGEFDHKIRYPYRTQNKFLRRYSGIISKNASQLDDMISTCLQIDERELDSLDRQFKSDRYVEWTKPQVSIENNIVKKELLKQDKVEDIHDLVRNKIVLRKR